MNGLAQGNDKIIAMEVWLPLVTVFVSGFFGLIVAVATTNLANRQSNDSYQRELAQKKYENVRAVYVKAVANLELIIREIKRLDSYEVSHEKLAENNALLQLTSTPYVLEHVSYVSDLLYEWSTAYKRGQPDRITTGDTVTTLVSSVDAPKQKKEREKAVETYQQLSEALTELVQRMKTHLQQLEPK